MGRKNKSLTTKKLFKEAKPVVKEPGIFAPSIKIGPSTLGGVDRLKHEVDILATEWAIKYPNLHPRSFLLDIKSYSPSQADGMLALKNSDEWLAQRAKLLDKMTESVVKRHIDLIAEVQDQHIRASKLTLAKAVEMLTKMQLEPLTDSHGKLLRDKNGKPIYRGIRSIDLLNCASTIEKAQQIYRRAMGLPNDEGGLQQILEKIEQMPATNVQINQQVNITGSPNQTVQRLEKELSYDDIMAFVKAKREQKALEVKEDEGDGQTKI